VLPLCADTVYVSMAVDETSLTTPRRRNGRRARLVMLGAFLAIGAIGGLLFAQLQAREDLAHRRADRAHAAVASVLRIDGLEWRAIAGEDPSEIRARLDTEVEAFRSHRADAGEEDLTAASESYLAAIDAELAALLAGDRSAAEAIDNSRVDPAYESVIDLANEMAVHESNRAAATEREVRAIAWGLSLATTGLLGAGCWIALRIRDRRETERKAAEVEVLLRAMVHSSQDVFTTITASEDVTVISSSLGFLARFAGSSNGLSLLSVLSVEQLARWREADDRVQRQRTDVQVALEIVGEDGAIVHVEAQGSLFPGRPGDRIWIWRNVTARKELEQHLTHRVTHDPLTGVANRDLLMERTKSALSRVAGDGQTVSILYCDVDRFKTVNDTLGHDAGDQLLRIVASRIARCLRSTDTLARLGGDEFAILIEGADTDTASAMGERIVEAIGAGARLAGTAVDTSVSVGLASSNGDLGALDLLRAADVAMYRAKQASRSQLVKLQLGSASSMSS
jgi:diguanylate cyclase (GGDEF)-like protein